MSEYIKLRPSSRTNTVVIVFAQDFLIQLELGKIQEAGKVHLLGNCGPSTKLSVGNLEGSSATPGKCSGQLVAGMKRLVSISFFFR